MLLGLQGLDIIKVVLLTFLLPTPDKYLNTLKVLVGDLHHLHVGEALPLLQRVLRLVVVGVDMYHG